MGKLVSYDGGNPLLLRVGTSHRIVEDGGFPEGHQTPVLHGSGCEVPDANSV